MNRRVHGIDVSDVRDGFDFVGANIVPSYGKRFAAAGPLGGRLVTVVFSLLGTEALSIVSSRPASRQERRLHENR